MRIAWIVYGSLEERTGGTIYDRMVVEGLRRAGDEVDVVSLGAPPASPALAIPVGAAKGVRAGRALRRARPDVVVGDELCFREIAAAFPFMRRTRARRVLLVHHLTCWEAELSRARRWLSRRAEHIAIDASDRIVTTSRATRDRLVAEMSHARRGGVPVIDVVVPGADRLPVLPSVREASGAGGAGGAGGAHEPPVELLFVGAIIPRKRVLELVRAFARRATPPARLTLLGSADQDRGYARAVARTIDRLGVGDRIVMAGEVDEHGVARALARADALVMPSSLEGWGIAATEAIRAGVPVIAARAAGLEEALAPAAAAARFVDDEEGLATAIGDLTRDASARAAMRRAAEEAASRMPTWSRCVEGFREAIASV